MNFNNRYVRLGLLTLLLALLIYILIFLILSALKVNDDFPAFLHVTVSLLGAGYLVYQFLSDRVQ